MKVAGSQALFTPIRVGANLLQHRVVLAPMTRIRANADHTPSPPMVEYYGQRASVPGTLLITEGCVIAPEAGGWDNVPGIWSDAQIEGWKRIVEEVHAKGSFIYLQLWALGRAASIDSLAKEAGGPFDVVSASDLAFEGGAKPRPMSIDEVRAYPFLYAQAAKNFVELAGGDGVEIHSASGYIIDQFLQTNSNTRTDEYGGSVANRLRFGLEVAAAVVEAVGENRTGVRISPWNTFQGMRMPFTDTQETFSAYIRALKSTHPALAYLHAVEGRAQGYEVGRDKAEESLDFFNALWAPSPFIVAGGYQPANAVAKAESSDNALVAFARPFISNPDLPFRIRANLPLAKYDRATFYVPGPESTHGYTDYPPFAPSAAV